MRQLIVACIVIGSIIVCSSPLLAQGLRPNPSCPAMPTQKTAKKTPAAPPTIPLDLETSASVAPIATASAPETPIESAPKPELLWIHVDKADKSTEEKNGSAETKDEGEKKEGLEISADAPEHNEPVYLNDQIQESEKEGLPVMFFVTGEDETQANNMEKRLFTDPEAIELANKSFICLKLDIGLLAKEQIKKFKLRKAPAIIVMYSTGKVARIIKGSQMNAGNILLTLQQVEAKQETINTKSEKANK